MNKYDRWWVELTKNETMVDGMNKDDRQWRWNEQDDRQWVELTKNEAMVDGMNKDDRQWMD